MCERYSWLEVWKDGVNTGQVIFLTEDDLQTEKGQKILAEIGLGDFVGHGAIKKYYDCPPVPSGCNIKDRECTDFSSPNNFPAEIVSAIKSGKMRGLGVSKEMFCLFTDPAWAEYKKIADTAWAEYKKIKDPAWAEYKKITDTTLVEYEKIKDPAWAEYKKIKDPAWAEYKKIKDTAFWDIFTNPENRNPLWR